MDPQDNEVRTTRTTVEHDTESRWAHKNPGGLWWLALAAIPLVLAALGSVVRADGIETDLKVSSLAALKAQGMDDVSVSFDGRDASLSLPSGSTLSGEDLERARALVADLDGVRVADADVSAAEAAEEPAVVESEDPTEAASEEPSPEPTPEPSEEPAADPCAVDVVSAQVLTILGEDKIQFGEKSAQLDDVATDEVSQVAALLVGCPDLAITVSGHTDNLGAAGTLSARRADAVTEALAAGGITRGSITSVGARDADPLGDNATQEGRDMNRYADIAVK